MFSTTDGLCAEDGTRYCFELVGLLYGDVIKNPSLIVTSVSKNSMSSDLIFGLFIYFYLFIYLLFIYLFIIHLFIYLFIIYLFIHSFISFIYLFIF